MKQFSEYITEENIVFYLCRMRAKLAKQRNKKHLLHLLSSNPRYDYQKKKLLDSENELLSLLPNRKKWKKLGQKQRHKGGIVKNGQVLNSIDKGIKSISVTIEYYRRVNPSEPFLIKLDQFIESVKNSFFDSTYSITKPETYPKPKDDKKGGEIICRPISLFSLKDKIIICLTNKFFTDLFDSFFYNNSLAFRAKRVVGSTSVLPTHHDAIKKIKEYQSKNRGKSVWVTECDMMKFYDTVNHSVIRQEFKRLLRLAKKKYPLITFETAESIFYKYLESYAFNKDVFPLNKNQEYFKKFKINNGKFGWVHDELLEAGYYKSINKSRIGIPQGGALSGLISNIVLDYADRQILKIADQKLLYIRYCDDMIIMHPQKKHCQKIFDSYKNSLKRFRLLPHDADKKVPFWKAKTKLPYRWGNEEKGGERWIGFVGYEMSYDGFVRVRKSSLEKEMKKQYNLVLDMVRAVERNDKNARNKKIEESVINRLIGMSVGKVKLWNASSLKNEMCWVNGFSEITDNKYTRKQLQRLDASRNELIIKLKAKLAKQGDFKEPDKGKKVNSRAIIYYGKPFSYYYQALEKKKEFENNQSE